MKKPPRSRLIGVLFLTIILEGYIVLASELLAMREVISFVGSGTDVASIIIAAVLMPLAAGYYAGGNFRKDGQNKNKSVRRKLIRNIIIAAAILLPGLSYVVMEQFFAFTTQMGVNHRLVALTLYSVLFLVTPVYLLGQTVPLVSHFFSRRKLAEITGRMLFFSTVGSFLGAIVSTLILMAYLGVHHTVGINFVLMAFLVWMLAPKRDKGAFLQSACILALALLFNSSHMMKEHGIIENNQYNTVSIIDDLYGHDKGHHLLLNNSLSSYFSPGGKKYAYVFYAEQHFLYPLMDEDRPKADILVIGTGGFTFGLEDEKNDYTYVDIDASLKDVAEQDFLKRPLAPNKKFVAEDARAFLAHQTKKYDLVMLDTYSGLVTIPEYLLTREYFQQVKNVMKDGGVMIANIIAAPQFEDRLSRHMDNTIRSVFPHVNRQIPSPDYEIWDNNGQYETTNVLYSYKKNAEENASMIYTDDKNQSFIDKPKNK